MKTPYLNSLISKLNHWELNDELSDEQSQGLDELLKIQKLLTINQKTKL